MGGFGVGVVSDLCLGRCFFSFLLFFGLFEFGFGFGFRCRTSRFKAEFVIAFVVIYIFWVFWSVD